ncbi:Anthrax toxin receptor-like [Manis javanica]|nr:Anthrax toxin receptor-like [Manis javanica]
MSWKYGDCLILRPLMQRFWAEDGHVRSHSVNNNWMFTRSFVQDLVNRFKNPKQRVSFITYSTHGRINMKLTSDREQISNSVIELLNVLPTGAINMQHGLEKANEQIERTRAAGAEVPSLIIVLTGGELLPESLAETKVEAAKSKQLGASLFFVGVQNYQKYQLLEIAGEEDHVFGVDSGYPGLEDIVDPLVARSCVQITSVDFSRICSRGIKAVSVQDTSITCPGLKMNNRGWAIFIDISLNNGLTFIRTDLDVSRRNCVTSRKGSPPALLGAIPPAAQQRALPVAVPEDTQDIYPDERSSSPVFPSFNTLFWAVPLLVLLFILLLCWCIWRRYPKSSPAPLAQKCPMVIMSCCGNHDKEKTEELERCHSAVPLMMPHCGSLSCGTGGKDGPKEVKEDRVAGIGENGNLEIHDVRSSSSNGQKAFPVKRSRQSSPEATATSDDIISLTDGLLALKRRLEDQFSTYVYGACV